MTGQTIYTSFDALDETFLFREEYAEHAILHDIILEYSDVMVDLEDDEFEKKVEENPFLKALVKRENKYTFSLRSFFVDIEAQNLDEFPHDIFILDKTKEYCAELMEKYGVLVMPNTDLSGIKHLTVRHRKDLRKNEPLQHEQKKGWQAFFAQSNPYPVNSLILIDNYIFKKIDSGIRNLVEIIRSVLPEDLDCTFEILIITDNRDGRYTKEKIEKILNQIENKISGIKDYPVSVGIVLSGRINDELHQRIILTNYHLIKTDKGFNVFDSKGRSSHPEDITMEGAYHTLNGGDPEIKTLLRKLEAVKDIFKETSEKNNAGFMVGNFSNRFLD